MRRASMISAVLAALVAAPVPALAQPTSPLPLPAPSQASPPPYPRPAYPPPPYPPPPYPPYSPQPYPYYPPPPPQAGLCDAGAEVPCPCPDGTWGAKVCDPSGTMFSACRCAGGAVLVPPGWSPAPTPLPLRGKRRNGLGMTIGGGVTLNIGASSLAVGILRLQEDGKDGFGIASTIVGGFGLFFGLPILIIGIVDLAKHGVYGKAPSSSFALTPSLTLTPSPGGLALHL